MKVSANMQWAIPYLNAAKASVRLDRVKSITGYEPKPWQDNVTQAIIYKKGCIYDIKVNLNDSLSKMARLEDLLIALAHELAHIKEWEHTGKHLDELARILRIFARVTMAEKVADTSKRLRRRKVV